MARRVYIDCHVRCVCGQLCPLISCCCSNEQHRTGDRTCTWCTWWDEHEPHDLPSWTSQKYAETVKATVEMMNSGNINANDAYPEGRYHGD